MVRLLLVASLGLVACKPEPTPTPTKPKQVAPTPKPDAVVVRGTLRRTNNVETGYAVAVPAGSDPAALEKLARKKAPSFDVKRASIADLFTGDQLAFLTGQLSPSDAAGVKASPAVIVLSGSGIDAMKLAREIATVARDVADASHGWVFDPVTFQIHPAVDFHDHVPTDHPDARKLIVVHTVAGDNDQPFLDSAGLRRYGFPELYFSEAATGHVDQVGHLINGVAQTLLDGGDVNERGEITVDFHKLGWDVDIIGDGTGRAVLKARWTKERDAHDDDELVVELVPPAGAGPEGAVKLIAECFGHGPDQVTMLSDDDPELLAAAARARADLAKLRSHFAKGIPVDERLTVKAKFTGGDGQVEWMWIDVVAFRADVFEGTLANEPGLIKTLRNGQKVKAKLADIGDYLHGKMNGQPAGGYSIELMRKRGLLPEE